MKTLWASISEIGIDEDYSLRKKKRIRVSNRVGLLLTLMTIPHFFTYIEVGAYLIASIQIATTLTIFSSLLFNYLRLHLIAKLVIPVTGTLNVFLTSSTIGFESGEHLAFLTISLLSLMLFDIKRYYIIGLNFLLIIICVLVLESTDYSLLSLETINSEDQRGTYIVNFFATFFAGIVIAYYFQNYSDRQFNDLIIRTKEQLQAVFDNSYDAMFVVDPESQNIVTCNKRALIIFDANTTEELIGINLRGLRQKEFTPKELEGFSIQKAFTNEFEYISQMGRPFWGSVAYTYISYGDQTQMLVRITDISEKKAYERGLIDAKLRAEAADRSKTLFLANMSHELRTPINGIIGLSEIIEEEFADDEELVSYTNLLKASGERLHHTIETILDLSHLEGDLIKVNWETFCLNELVHTVFQELADKATQKGLAYEFVHPNINFFVKLDTTLLNKILSNIIENAIKFTKEGYVKVSIFKYIDPTKPSNDISISIEDSGIGMSKEFVNGKLFTEFVQESEGFDRVYEGSGIGLALVKKYINLLEGTIIVESNQGIGTTFTLTFPFEYQEQSNTTPSPSTLS